MNPSISGFKPPTAPAQFGSGPKPQQGAPKFGFIEPISCSIACATCCAAPLAIPIGGFIIFKLLKKLKNGAGSIVGGLKNLPSKFKKSGPDGAAE